jgi:hypothetical protein
MSISSTATSGPLFLDLLQGCFPILCFGDEFEGGLARQDLAQASAKDRMIIGNHNTNLAHPVPCVFKEI